MANSVDPDVTVRSSLFAQVYVLVCQAERVKMLHSILYQGMHRP